MLISVGKLVGPALDWAVARCENRLPPHGSFARFQAARNALYSTDWAFGGPIIDREMISLNLVRCNPDNTASLWRACCNKAYACCGDAEGGTQLIAAMRCYITSKLGDEVNVPEELC